MGELEAVEDQITNAWAALHTALETKQQTSVERLEDQLEVLHKEQQELYDLASIH